MAIYWTMAVHAVAIVRQCRSAMTNDIASVAAALHVPITDHSTVVQRATNAVERMDALLDEAKRSGAMSGFNRAYSAARAAARAEGKGMMPYNAALDRLKRELYKCAAGATIDHSIIATALGFGSNKQ